MFLSKFQISTNKGFSLPEMLVVLLILSTALTLIGPLTVSRIEKQKHNSNFFSTGAITVSPNDKLLAYSLDLKGSEYYSIFVRQISNKKFLSQEIKNIVSILNQFKHGSFRFFSIILRPSFKDLDGNYWPLFL